MGMVFKNNCGRSKEHKWVASMQGFFKRGEATFSLVLIGVPLSFGGRGGGSIWGWGGERSF